MINKSMIALRLLLGAGLSLAQQARIVGRTATTVGNYPYISGGTWKNRYHHTLCLLALVLSFVTLSQANQPGFIDPTFKTGSGVNDGVSAMVRQKDGKVLIGGYFTAVQGVARKGIARLLATGAVDLTFNPGSGVDSGVLALAVQADGKVLIGGDFTTYNGTVRNSVARLNADGSLDAGFSPGTGANSDVLALAVQVDGKVLIGGKFTTYNGVGRSSLARVNANGSLDTGFDPGSGADRTVYTLGVQTDGKVLLGGEFTTYNGVGRSAVARVNVNGSLDTGFDPGSGADSTVNILAFQTDGKVLIGGAFSTYNGVGRESIARVNADGTLDTGFAPGPGADSDVVALALQPGGKVLIGGYFTTYNGIARNRIARVNSDGSLDTGFDPGTGANSDVLALVAQPDGKVLAAGYFTTHNGIGRNRVARLLANGATDLTFNPGTGANGAVLAIAAQTDGKVLIGGEFTSYNGTARSRIARVNADGSLDLTFNPGTGAGSTVSVLSLQPDGKVLIGGVFMSYNGTTRNRIARVNPDGSLDTGFDPGSGASSAVSSIAVQADGKVLIGGVFTTYNGTGRNRIARLNPDGSLDTGFNPGTGAAGGVVNALAVQPDGKVLISGSFTTYNDTGRNRIARVNPDGSLDSGFDPGTGANSGNVVALVLQRDGKVLIGGSFTTYAGTARNGIARVNTDGSLDTGFNPGTRASSNVNGLALQPDGKVVIAGNFTLYNGIGRNRIARVNPDGSLDMIFNPGTGASRDIRALTVQLDGKALIGGSFTSYDGRSAGSLARVLLGYAHAAATFTGITNSTAVSNAPLFGQVVISLTATGSFTGSINLGTESLKLAGAFGNDGRAAITSARLDKNVVFVSLALGRGASGGPFLEGQLSDYSGRTATLEAHAPFFSATTLPANHFSGTYPIALDAGSTEALQPVSGAGLLTCTMSTAGKATLVGKAPDGTALSASVNLNQDGELLMHFPLYAGKGFLNGIVAIDDNTFTTTALRPVSGSLLWRNPPGVIYPVGFLQALTATGSQYLPKASTLPPFGGTPVNSVDVTISGGFLTPVTSQVSFGLTGTGAVATGNISNLKISVNPTAGTFSGSFLPAGSTKIATIQGVLTDSVNGLGYTLVNIGGAVRPAKVTMVVVNP